MTDRYHALRTTIDERLPRWIDELADCCRIPSEASGATFQQLTEATPLQARALQLLGL